ncbi:PLP-dependent aminotransferase family protein [Roseovarius sp. MMSF_3281]|uniref:aminotransferase-like domain-containing protein n=1 Tax=Roseovarius sp. MMSF_3281 TaxID=3046694 RepID=UPI00273DB0A0|nr:PLP-dependent aminotransferase family protein [Roseovarius sp. MMSF_3281]
MIQSLRTAVRSGVLEQGYKMPTVRDLAWKLGITPGTVARAYRMAAEEGLVETTVGRGTFVAGAAPVRVDVTPDEPLISEVAPDAIDLRASRVLDVGQEAVIRAGLSRLAESSGNRYRDYPDSQSSAPAQEAVMQWVGPDRAGRLQVAEVVMGLGAQHSVIMALQTCLQGTAPVILTESLCYPGVRHAARLLRAQVIGVDMDEEGVRPDRLEEALQKHGGQVFLTAAETHSPTAVRTPLARRQAIARVAQRYQLQIIEDDCHCITRPETPAYRAICPENAWYISSLTKSVSSALRFGFAICPRGRGAAAQQVAQSSFYGMPQPILDLGADLIKSGQAEEVRTRVLAAVEARVRMAVNILGKWNISWQPSLPFVWLRLPQGWRGSTFMRACDAAGLQIKSADEFALPDGQAPHAVRVALTPDTSDAVLGEALERLSGVLECPPVAVDL